MADRSDEELDELLRSLPPAPAAWIARAEEIPLLQRAAASLGPPAEGTRGDVATALAQVGLEPDAERVALVRQLRDRRRA